MDSMAMSPKASAMEGMMKMSVALNIRSISSSVTHSNSRCRAPLGSSWRSPFFPKVMIVTGIPGSNSLNAFRT